MQRSPDDTVFVTASHAVLFEQPSAAKCDACGGDIEPDEGFSVGGEGEYLWTRGTEVRREKAPLCPHCGAAILGAALARWEIEEDEG
jgi:hypothetical protein